MARIVFTDSQGLAVLASSLNGDVAGGVAARFAGWTPFQRPIGPKHTALGTGQQYRFRFRTDYGARFALEELSTRDLAVALRLQHHLEDGGTCAVYTEDAEGRSYASCGLAPEAEVVIEQTDRALLRYRCELTLINLGAAAPMLCDYEGATVEPVVLLAWTPDTPGGTFSRASTATSQLAV